MKSTLLTMTASLTLIAASMGCVLAYVHDLTEEPIAQAQAKARNEALASVLPQFDTVATQPIEITNADDSRPVDIYPATLDGKPCGAAVETWTMDGFSGEITVMVGFDTDGEITGYKVLTHAETPGLGAKADQWFRSTEGKRNIIGSNSPLSVSKDGGEVDGITAATITSRAFLGAVNRARTAYESYKSSQK